MSFESDGGEREAEDAGDGVPSIRVLLVDDDADYRTLCRRYLRRSDAARFEVEGVDTGRGAVSSCRERRFDCVLIDYRLPDATGTDLLAELRDALGDEMPPAIILSALGGEAAAAEAVRAGASDYLAKRDVSRESLSRTLVNAAEKGRLRQQNLERRRELAHAYEALRRRNEEIQRFYHTVSHEVKTPLTAIREFLSIMRDDLAGPTSGEQQELIGHALESCDQLVGQFDDLVTLTRLQTGKLTIVQEWTSLDGVIARCLAAACALAAEKGIEVIDLTERPLPSVHVDRNRIAQVLANLLNNAIKYTGEHGRVALGSRVDLEAGQLSIAVTDSGPGIAPEHLAQVFDRLYQVAPNLCGANEGGLGLGLSIAREIVHGHGGQLDVDSVVGEGSTFSFTVPTRVDAFKPADPAPTSVTRL